jgi:hypothetical protein
MPLPDFTDDEQYLVNSVKSPNAAGKSNSYMWGYIIGAVTFAGFGVYHENVPMLLTALVVVVSFRIYEERYQMKWMPHWRSIIVKYEAACVAESEDRTDNPQDEQSD